MYCKRCGMDSENTEVCDWCKQPMIAGGPQPEGDVETQAEVAPQSEVEVTPMASPGESAGDDAAYVPDEQPLPKVTAPPLEPESTLSNGVRMGVSVGAAITLGIVFLLAAHFITKETPTHLYAGYLRIPGEGIGTTLISGALFGLILGVLVGGLLCLTHLGPAVGLIIGLVLGYVVLSQPGFGYVSALCGAVIGIVAGIACNWGYKRRLSV